MNKNELMAELEKDNNALVWASDIQKKAEDKALSDFACVVSGIVERQANLIAQLKALD